MILQYLKNRIGIISLLLLLIIVWYVYIFLQFGDLNYFLYPLLLWGFVIFVYGMIDFICYQRKYRQLQKLKNAVEQAEENFPECNGGLEQLYQELFHLYHEMNTREKTRQDQETQERLQYFTMWVHQIKTPVSGLRLLLQQAEQGNELDIRDIRALMQEVFHIEQYVGMVLTYLRLEQHSSDLVIKEQRVDKELKQSIKKFATLFIQKGLSIEVDISDELVVTDSKWLSFILEQLLSNAVKYTNRGTVCVTFKNRQLVVRDTGIGIAGEDLPRIFERGYTGYNGRIDKQSTGIGLYLVGQVVKRIGATIEVVSETTKASQKGTTVTVTLPMKENLVE